MRKHIILLAAFLMVLAVVPAQGGKKNRSHVIGFYNLENLFDTYHDDGKNDYEYLPQRNACDIIV